MACSLEFVVFLVKPGREILFFLWCKLGAYIAGAGFNLRNHFFGAGHLVVGTGENGAAVAPHFADMTTVAFVLIKQFFAHFGIAIGKRDGLGGAA